MLFNKETFIFEGTLKENVDPKREYSDEKIKEALIRTGFLTSSRNSIEYRLEQNGDNLSEGEKQILAIARAIVRVMI